MQGEHQANATTVWQALATWAQTLEPWQQKIIAMAVDHRTLTEAETREVYSDYLAASRGPAKVATPAASASTDPADVPVSLDRIECLSGVNALPDNSTLTFGPGLTVIFGRNGVGKSGFARALSNACFSRSTPAIIPNIYDDQSPKNIQRCSTLGLAVNRSRQSRFRVVMKIHR